MGFNAPAVQSQQAMIRHLRRSLRDVDRKIEVITREISDLDRVRKLADFAITRDDPALADAVLHALPVFGDLA